MLEVPYGATGSGKVGFPGLGIEEFSLNRVAFTIFGINIYWYAIMIVTGFALAIVLGFHLLKRTYMTQDNMLDMILIATPTAIICARLYYVLMDSGNSYDSFLDVINIRNGGLAIYGAIIGAVLAIVIYCSIKKVNAADVLDFIGPCFLLAQGIGRWGNFFNQEAFGKATDSFLRMTIHFGGQQYSVHPTFLYESLWNLLGAVLLYFLFKNRKYLLQVFLHYLSWYGLGRAFIEPLRIDSLYIPGTKIAVSLVVAVVCVVVAEALAVTFDILNRKGKLPAYLRLKEKENA